MNCDLIIRDATVFDGTGAPRFAADVGVTGDRIVAVGDLGAASADREVIATGKALAPGFIDAHTHDDRAVLCGPDCMLCKMSQGVTTVVVGNCGISLSPVRMTIAPGAAARSARRRILVDVRQLRRIRRTSGARSAAGEHLCADRPHVAARRGDGRRHAARRHRQGSRAHAAPAGRGAGAGCVRLLHRPVLSAEHDGADRRGDRGRRGAARCRRDLCHPHARRSGRRAAVDRGDAEDRPRRRTCRW